MRPQSHDQQEPGSSPRRPPRRAHCREQNLPISEVQACRPPKHGHGTTPELAAACALGTATDLNQEAHGSRHLRCSEAQAPNQVWDRSKRSNMCSCGCQGPGASVCSLHHPRFSISTNTCFCGVHVIAAPGGFYNLIFIWSGFKGSPWSGSEMDSPS